jgi:ribosomal protein S18 acetylase RimI-like enzyme
MGTLRATADRVGVMVRDLMPSDRDAVRAMLVDCGAFSDAEINTALEMVEDGLRGDYTLLAVERDGILSAFACIGKAYLTASSWYLYWICVHPRLQGAGVGRLLQASVEDFVRKAGGTRLVLEASGRPDNDRVGRFYRKAGFHEVGRIGDFYKPGDDCVIYCKSLG